MKGRYTLYTLLLLSIGLKAQDTTRYANPKVDGMPSGKGVEVKGEYITPFHIASTSHIEGIRNANGLVRKNERFEAKLRVPVINKPSFKLVLGGSYSKEEFYFEESTKDANYPLFQNLEDKPLKITGATAYVIKSFNEKHFLAARLAWRLQGDYSSLDLPMSDFAKYTVALMYGTKPNNNTVWAPGLHYSDNFGRKSLFPVFMYNKTFSPKWGIESTLPVEVKLRHNISSSSLAYLKVEATGAQYNIHLRSPLYPQPSVFLEQSEVRLTMALEQRMFWWVWINIEGGARQTLGSNVTIQDKLFDNTDRVIQNNEFGLAGIIVGSVFIRPNKVSE
jgi:hypothetical protein